MIAFPYIAIGRIGNGPMILQPYGLILLAGLGLGTLTAWRLAKRVGLRDWGFLPIAIPVAFVFAHFYDVIFYSWARAGQEPAVWIKLFEGISLMGGLLGVTVTTLFIATVRKLELPKCADVVTGATLVAMTVGRIGCALVHDHPGIKTESPLGVDFPMIGRMYDLGLLELFVLLPLTGAALALVGRLRAGTVAGIAMIAYAVARFPLDYLRLSETEPTHLSFTAGQWGCFGLVALGIVTLVRR